MNKMHRVKLDPNRAVDEAAFGEPLAVETYEYYHNLIVSSRELISSSGNYSSLLLIDLHGQSHSHNLTEIGYNLTAPELDSGNYALEQTSTVRYAASRMRNSKELITGNVSIAYFIEQQSIKCMPSPTSPQINGRSYFTGGYTVRTHCSDKYDAIQIEMARTVRMVDSKQLELNMQQIARAIVDFLQYHYPATSPEPINPFSGGCFSAVHSNFLLLFLIAVASLLRLW